MKKRCCGKPELTRLLRENDDVPFEAILAEVGIEGEGMVESVMVDQSKAGAIDEAKVFVIVSHKNRLGGLFYRFTDTKYFDPGLIKTLHEVDSHAVTDFGKNESIGF